MAIKQFEQFLKDNYRKGKANKKTYLDEVFVKDIAHKYKISYKTACKKYAEMGITILEHDAFVNQFKVR